jgi:hypothetical protein
MKRTVLEYLVGICVAVLVFISAQQAIYTYNKLATTVHTVEMQIANPDQ